MTLPAWTEVQLAIGGALKLARGDRRGLGFFDISIDGFWRSFRAALMCYPFYLVLLSFRVAAPYWEASGVPRIVVVETIGYAISWVAFPLLVMPLARWLGREDRFLAFMVAYNWCQVPQTLLFVILGADAATGLFSAEFAQVAEFAAAVAVLVYEWYIARVALAVSPAQAVPVVLLDLLLGTLLGQVTTALY
jgi:hypothetical protein